MAIPIIRSRTLFGLEEEVTQGTYVAPSAATSYAALLQEGFDITPSKELVDRNLLTDSIGKPTPRPGIKGVSGSVPIEYRASGTEGAVPDGDSLLQSALGQDRAVASQFTTGTGHSTTTLEGTNIHTTYLTGDMFVILESASHHIAWVTGSAQADQITFTPAASFTPSDGVLLSKTQTYFSADTGHPALSLSFYQGDEIRQAALGALISSMSIDGFTTGGVASYNFGFEGLSMTEVDGSAPHTPTFDSSLPPIILNSCLHRAGTQIDINDFSLSLTNSLAFQTSTCDSNGRESSRVTDREITGTYNPFKDDTTFVGFTQFDDNTTYSLTLSAYIPSSTAGEFTLGSVVGLYLPSCITTDYKAGNQEGLITDEISFRAGAGDSGDNADIYIGMV